MAYIDWGDNMEYKNFESANVFWWVEKDRNHFKKM